MKSTFKIVGMHCGSCKILIEDVCGDIPGVRFCEVSFDTGVATIEHDDSVDVSQIEKAILSLGEYKIEKIV